MDPIRFFSEYQYRVPSPDELKLLNAFLGSVKNSPSHYTTASISTNETCVAKPLFDLMRMYRTIDPEESALSPIDKLFDTIRKAADHRKAHDFSWSYRKIFISANDEIAKIDAVLNGYEPEFCENGVCVAANAYTQRAKKQLIPRGEYSTVVIFPGEFSAPDAMLKFARTISKNKKALAISVSRGRDVFSGICSLSGNLTVKFNSLNPLTKASKDNSLSLITDALFSDLSANQDNALSLITDALFSDSLFGDVAITVVCKKKHARSIHNLARIRYLYTCTAIEITKTPKFSIYFNGQLLSEMRPDVFKILSAPELLNVTIPSMPTAEDSFPEVTKLCEFRDNSDTVYSVTLPLAGLGFKNAASTIVAPLISAAFDGFNKKNSNFSFAFKASINLSGNEHVSDLYSALAAIYGSTRELGFPTDSTFTSMTDGESSLTVYLRVAPFGKKATLSTALSRDAVMKFVFEGRPSPDFSVIKELIEG